MKLRLLPTNPPRYLSFIVSVFNPQKTFWAVVENGRYVSPSVSSFEVILTLWASEPPATVYDELHEEFVPLALGA